MLKFGRDILRSFVEAIIEFHLFLEQANVVEDVLQVDVLHQQRVVQREEAVTNTPEKIKVQSMLPVSLVPCTT